MFKVCLFNQCYVANESDLIGKGAFSKVYRAQRAHGGCSETPAALAIKVEPSNPKHPMLTKEYEVYCSVACSPDFFPKVYGPVVIGDVGESILSMELLHDNLEKIFKWTCKQFTFDQVIKVGLDVMDSLKVLHSKGYVHRDLKPDNFLLNKPENRIVLADFGLARKYTDEIGNPLPESNEEHFVGTCRYASFAAHEKKTQCPRDDLISLCLVLFYLILGKLPWQGCKDKTEVYNKKIKYLEKLLIIHQKCTKLVPVWNAINNLSYGERPDYEHLRTLLIASQ